MQKLFTLWMQRSSAMWYGMDKIQQIFLKIAGLLLFAIFFVIIILATGSPKEHQPDISAIVVILFVLLAVVTLMIIINRIHTCSQIDGSGKRADEKQETFRKLHQNMDEVRTGAQWMN